MLAAALSKQEASLSGLAATSDTLLSAAGPTFLQRRQPFMCILQRNVARSSTRRFWLEWEEMKF